MRRLVISAISSATLSSGLQVTAGRVITSPTCMTNRLAAVKRQRVDDVTLGDDAVDALAVVADDECADAAGA